MLEILMCKDCGKYFTIDQTNVKGICYEEEYGVVGDFSNNNYDNVCCCPFCDSVEIKEVGRDSVEDIVEALNNYENQIYVKQNVVKEIVKLLDSRELKEEYLKSKLISAEFYNQFLIRKIKERYNIKDEK